MKKVTTVIKYLTAAFLSTSLASTVFGAPGYIAPPAKLVEVPSSQPIMISNLLMDALGSDSEKHQYTVQIRREDRKNSGKLMDSWLPVTLLYERRQEPDAAVGTNLLLVDDRLFELGEIDIDSAEVKDDTIMIKGGAGYYNHGPETCGYFRGASRTVVIKFSYNKQEHRIDVSLKSQKDSFWCH